MEFIIYTTVTILLWVLSATWLLPFLIFLKFSKTYRDRWFSFFFVKLAGPMNERISAKFRICGFDLLKKHLGHRNGPLEILEIGIAEGSNLKFYPENSNLTVLDVNESFLEYFEENRRKFPQVSYKRTVVGMAEDMHQLEDDSFDVVVCTYVLCSVKSVHSALKEVKRVLKPGGKFLFLEHVIYPGVNWKSTIQHLTCPLWKIYLDGCCLNRETGEEIKKAGFTDTEMEMQYPEDLLMYTRPQIIGIATK